MSRILGRKLGMTQVFEEGGAAVQVTVIEARPGRVVAVKTREKDGYEAMQVGFFEDQKEKHHTKPMLGVFNKAGVAPCRKLREFPVAEAVEVGAEITVGQFEKGDRVAVTGVSKGKGFQGGMKRHNFRGGPASHGGMCDRAPGSIGASAWPSRVFKGKRMPGRMGHDKVTVRNLTVVDVRADQNLILIKGAVPGARNSVVEIRKLG